VVVQPATTPPVPLERPFDRLTVLSNVEGPPVPNIYHRAAPPAIANRSGEAGGPKEYPIKQLTSSGPARCPY